MRRPQAPATLPTWLAHWEHSSWSSLTSRELLITRSGVRRTVPTVVAAVGSAHARGAVTTFTTGVLRFPSRVLRPRCICGQCYHPRGAGGLVQLEGRVGLPQALLQGRALAPHSPLERRVLAAQGAVTVQEGEKPQVLFQGHSEF